MYIDFLFDVFKEFYSNDSIIYKSEEYSYKYLIENIEKLLLKYNKNRKLIGGFEKAKIFTKSSKILVKLKQHIEKVT